MDPAGGAAGRAGVAGRPLTCLPDAQRASVVHGSAGWCWEAEWRRRAPPLLTPWIPAVPFKLNQDRRHHIRRQKHKVTNWPDYDASLRQRGSLTVWFTAEAVEAWAAEPRTTRGGQPWYSALAILTRLKQCGTATR